MYFSETFILVFTFSELSICHLKRNNSVTKNEKPRLVFLNEEHFPVSHFVPGWS